MFNEMQTSFPAKQCEDTHSTKLFIAPFPHAATQQYLAMCMPQAKLASKAEHPVI